MWETGRAAAHLANDKKLAADFRDTHESEVAHLSDPDLLAAVTDARQRVLNLGIKDRNLRMRFVKLGVFGVPSFGRTRCSNR
ncbi:hypothetical protein V8J85_17110 [Yoonia sp. 2307UL14-13]